MRPPLLLQKIRSRFFKHSGFGFPPVSDSGPESSGRLPDSYSFSLNVKLETAVAIELRPFCLEFSLTDQCFHFLLEDGNKGVHAIDTFFDTV